MKESKIEKNGQTGKWKAFLTDNRKIFFFLFAALSLIIPDLVLRANVFFVDFRVDDSALLRFFLCHGVAIIFSACWIGLIIFLCVFVMPKKAGRIVFVVIAALADIFMISESVYYTMFGRFFMLSSIFLVNEGAAYFDILYQYITPWHIIYLVMAIGSIVATCFFWEKITVRKRFWAIGPVFIAICAILNSYMTVSPAEKNNTKIWSTWKRPRYVYSDMADPDRCIRVMGMYQFIARSITYPLFSDDGYSEEDYKKVDEYIDENDKPEIQKFEDNEMTGYFKDKNVIAIMLESMDDWVLSEETTPTICRLMREGINFDRHSAATFGGGYTFNSEFAFNTGYYTPKSSSSASIYGYNEFPYSLPRLFEEAGYTAKQFHYNKMEFYNRGTMHKAFGYEEYVSFMDYMSEAEAELDSNAMLLENEEIYKSMVEEPKFFDFVITYTAHLPYNTDDKIDAAKLKYPELADMVSVEDFKAMMRGIDEASDEVDYSLYTDETWQNLTQEYNNARLLAHDTDEFIRLLLEKLDRDGLLEDTVIVCFTDHYTYGYSDENIVKGLSLLGGEQFIQETPFFIYLKGAPPMTVEKVSSTKDILPTMVNLFGLRKFGGYIGDDIFDPNNKGFVYFSDMTWFDGEIYRDDSYEPNEENREYVEEMDKKMMDCININDIIIAGNYFAQHK